jgi:hypothetical protein
MDVSSILQTSERVLAIVKTDGLAECPALSIFAQCRRTQRTEFLLLENRRLQRPQLSRLVERVGRRHVACNHGSDVVGSIGGGDDETRLPREGEA